MHNSYMQIKACFKKAIDSKKNPFSLNILSDLTKAPRSKFSCSHAWSEFPSPVQDADQMFHKSRKHLVSPLLVLHDCRFPPGHISHRAWKTTAYSQVSYEDTFAWSTYTDLYIFIKFMTNLSIKI